MKNISFLATAILGLMLATTICGQTSNQFISKTKAVKTPSQDDRLEALLIQRRNVLQKIADDCQQKYHAGLATDEEMLKADIAVLQAELELKHTKAERIGLHQKILNHMRQLEHSAEKRLQTGSITPLEFSKATLARVDAEIALEREKGGNSKKKRQ